VSEKLVNLKKQPKSPNPINKAAKAKSLGPLQIKYQNISDNKIPVYKKNLHNNSTNIKKM
jgi:hypothetical protein